MEMPMADELEWRWVAPTVTRMDDWSAGQWAASMVALKANQRVARLAVK